ncbi:MAG: flagellar hook-associated protein FlgK [Candidatus Acidiferrum sp.]
MGSLSASLNIAVQSLQAEQTAIQTTTNNIANANTPGYSRQVANFDENPPIQVGNLTMGSGVNISQVTSLRDAILDLRVNQETQQQGALNSFISAGQQIQSLFNETSGSGLQSSLSAFFNSLSALSTNPSDQNTRQAVLTAAQNLASSFNQASNNLSTIQQSEDLSVTQSVSQINTLTAQIASVNSQVSAATSSGQNPGPFIDQRQQLINQLSNLVDVSSIDAGNGSLTLTTSSGAPLVVGGQSFQLSTQTNPTTGVQDVYSQGNDITSKITGGELAGQIQIRDQEIPSITSSLDSLASGLVTAVNTQNQQGFDLNGNPGGNIFAPPPAGGTGAAGSMSVVMTDPSLIAASGGPAPGNAGDNTNANALLAIQNQDIINGQTPLNAYSNLVFKIGNDVSSAQSNEQSGSLVLQQLQNLQAGVSGVDVNEESANLIRFQSAYQASAQVSGIIDELMQTTIDMVPVTS